VAYWDSTGHVADDVTTRDPERLKGQSPDPNMLRAQYLENGWKYGLGFNGLPKGNDPL